MALVNDNADQKRKISYFGPFYIKNYATQPQGERDVFGEQAPLPVDISKYRIPTPKAEHHPVVDKSLKNVQPSGTGSSNYDSGLRVGSIPPLVHPGQKKPTESFVQHDANPDEPVLKAKTSLNGKTKKRQALPVRSKSEERKTSADVDKVLDTFDEILNGQYTVDGDKTFKISSTEDNYMYDKFKAKSKFLHEMNSSKRPDTTSHSSETSEIQQDMQENASNSQKATDTEVKGDSKDFLARHRSKISKLKRKFFESQQANNPISIDKVKEADKQEIKQNGKAPKKPPRSLPDNGHYSTESKATMMKNADTRFLEHKRRHSTDGIMGKADLEELRMRWSTPSGQYVAVVAIDFGTTYSGYAYSFYHDPDTINLMRRHDSGEPGVYNQKVPTSILLTPDGQFHSFGYAARDFYHDLDQKEAPKWMYFDRFKMMLHQQGELRQDSVLRTLSGKEASAMKVFACSLAYFKNLVLDEISDQSGMRITCDVIRWVITVPAIWKASAKQFMRQAAYQAEIVTEEQSDHLLIALEPEAASIYCRRLRMFHLLSEDVSDRASTSDLSRTSSTSLPELRNVDVSLVSNDLDVGTRYMVVDCGGGTVDITVHELLESGRLKELQRASGGAHGSVGVDEEFEKLLCRIFGTDIMNHFKRKRPAGYVDLMAMFESRKRTASPYRTSPIAISLPFSFIDFYKKTRGSSVASAVKMFADSEVSWTSNGLLKLSPGVMRRLFIPTVDRIKQSIGSVINSPAVKGISYMFLVGGFAESSIVQHEMRKDFSRIMKIIIPPEVSMTILKGAVCFGQDPFIVNSRCSCFTYGVGVLHRFDPTLHPENKKVTKDGVDWCTDIFDVFVRANQSVELGECVVRRYTPVRRDQTATTINIYSTEQEEIKFITDPGVVKCGALSLALTEAQPKEKRREVLAEMLFGDTEIRVRAVDVSGSHGVEATIDFINF